MDIANQSGADGEAAGGVHLVPSVIESIDVVTHFSHIGDILGLPIQLKNNDIFEG
jgi:hypothetical protein